MPELSGPLCAALNEQIKHELQSAYAYLKMSAECATARLKGSAHWLRRQWEEELGHAMKLLEYVIERGSKVDLKSIEEPRFEFKSLTDVFEQVLRNEQKVTADINALYEQSVRERDYAAQAFLQWFVTEQVEEENNAQEILDTLRVVGDRGTALLMVDRQLAQRT
jgi:ferritin